MVTRKYVSLNKLSIFLDNLKNIFATKTAVETLDDAVVENTTNISSLQSQVLLDSFIMADAITGDLYTLQIQNGQLVSFPVTE